MDYLDNLRLCRHTSWAAYRQGHAGAPGRLLLLTTGGDVRYTDFAFASGDTLLVGRETGGVPGAVYEAADARLLVPMAAGMRSLNVATAAAMVLGEALRQTGVFAGEGKA